MSLCGSLSAIPRCVPKGPSGGAAWVHDTEAVGGRGTDAAVVVRQVANDTVGAAADPRAGPAGVAADCLAGGLPQIRAECSCPDTASAEATLADAAAAGSAEAAVDCDAVAAAVPDVVVLRKLLPTHSDSAAAPGVGVVGAIKRLEQSWPVQTPAATT